MVLILDMRDNNTSFRLNSRSDLRKLIGAEPGHENPGIEAHVRFRNAAEPLAWQPRTLRFINKNHIAVIAEDRDEFAEPSE